jgi:hypothetical protein
MISFVMMIGSRSLNFEDEIFLRGVECNIPPVSIGILPVDRVRGLKFMFNKFNGKYLLYDVSSLRNKYQSRI